MSVGSHTQQAGVASISYRQVCLWFVADFAREEHLSPCAELSNLESTLNVLEFQNRRGPIPNYPRREPHF